MDRDSRYLRGLILKFFLTSTDLSSTSSPGNSGRTSIAFVLLKRDNVADNTHIACPYITVMMAFSSSSSASLFISECASEQGEESTNKFIFLVQLLTWSINLADNSDGFQSPSRFLSSRYSLLRRSPAALLSIPAMPRLEPESGRCSLHGAANVEAKAVFTTMVAARKLVDPLLGFFRVGVSNLWSMSSETAELPKSDPERHRLRTKRTSAMIFLKL
ncbi:hypothetical protein BJX62DRAFT_88422 [Aspergillus germanicus]